MLAAQRDRVVVSALDPQHVIEVGHRVVDFLVHQTVHRGVRTAPLVQNDVRDDTSTVFMDAPKGYRLVLYDIHYLLVLYLVALVPGRRHRNLVKDFRSAFLNVEGSLIRIVVVFSTHPVPVSLDLLTGLLYV